MISLSYDLHLHSCLSPCGDDDMTPANIAGMAAVKGLDVIALTDHNSCRNCPALLAAAGAFGVLAVPGMELTTREEVHVVCLFAELEGAMAFDRYVYERLLPIPNREEIFGKQQIYDEEDRICAVEPLLLISAADISFDEAGELAGRFGGVMFPAHIDKGSNSLLANLGFIPPDSSFRTAELSDMRRLHDLRRQHPYLEGCRILCSSDAHYLEQIHEPELRLAVRERSAAAVVEALGG